MPAFDKMLYSFQGVATISSAGKIYGDIEILPSNYKPLGIAVEDQKSWFDLMQLITMHSIDDQFNPKVPTPPTRILQKAISA